VLKVNYFQTFFIILPNLIHQSKKKDLKWGKKGKNSLKNSPLSRIKNWGRLGVLERQVLECYLE